MSSREFIELVQANAKADKIPKGTEFKVYDKYEVYICTVGVIRTTISYYDIAGALPQDLLIGEYTFIQQED